MPNKINSSVQTGPNPRTSQMTQPMTMSATIADKPPSATSAPGNSREMAIASSSCFTVKTGLSGSSKE